jgi:glycosyltransferase involved in cell wall biosynthesis
VKLHVLLKHGYRANDIDVVANFADDRLFTPLPPRVIDGHVQFVFHGTILERYGLKTLVEAVARARYRTRMRVRIIGEGDFSAELKELILSRGLSELIDFVNRVYPVSQIPAILADCHVGLVPLDITPISQFALPLKLVEYTCLGIPSVTVRTPAITHYLRSDECMLYTAGNVAELADVLDAIAMSPESLDTYRDRVLVARSRLSWVTEKGKYIDILRGLALQGTGSTNATVSESGQ